MTATKPSNPLFAYPPQAAFHKPVPKTKIYQHGRPSQRVRDLFVAQVEQIEWQYKLAPETLNLPASPAVPEIQIFAIHLRGPTLDDDVLRCIDKAIPLPILFHLLHGDQVRVAAAYKRPSEADKKQWVNSPVFAGPWQPATAPRAPLPMALNLEGLYSQLLQPLLPWPGRPSETLKAQIERIEQIRHQQQEIHKLEIQLAKEPQFNRKVGYNARLRELKSQLSALSDPWKN